LHQLFTVPVGTCGPKQTSDEPSALISYYLMNPG
jgi:hypothetical protein